MQITSTKKALSPFGVDIGVCTIISKNYLSYARVLADSFGKYHSNIPFFVLLVDRVDGYFKADQESFHFVKLEDLNIPDLDRFCFKYTILELNTAVKPYLLEHLFEQYHLQKIVYFDPDVLILNDLSSLFDLLNGNSIVLTPHLTAPIEEDGFRPSENDILRAGAYNLGFIALSNSPTTKKFLSWWQSRIYDKCLVAFEQGLFVDQRWIDLVPGLFEGVHILRDLGYNIAYWNLNSRQIEVRDGQALINGTPCYFFHFSGFNPENIKPISKHQNRFTIERVGQAQALFRQYRDLLLKRGYKEMKNWPYAFSHFDNGVKITELLRRIYLQLGDEVERFGNPFETTSPESYYNWLNENVDGYSSFDSRRISNLWYGVYKRRHDLQKAYPDIFGEHRLAFIEWMSQSGIADYSVDPHFLVGSSREHAEPKSVSQLYRKLTRPLEPSAKKFLRKTVGRNEVVWRKILTTHRRLKEAGGPHPSAESGGQGTNILVPSDSCIQQRSVHEQQRPFGVNLAGYIASEKGVGEALRSQIRCFEAVGIPYVLNDFRDSGSVNLDHTYTNFSPDNPYIINLVQVNADQMPHFVESKGKVYFQGHYNIGYWNWELSDFPAEWLTSFRYFDEVWVASSFALDSVTRVATVPVVRVPFSMAEEPSIKDWDRSAFKLPEDSFVFLFTFDFHSFLERKNPIGSIEAFRKAFNREDDVLLVLKCSHSSPDQVKALVDAADGSNVRIIDEVLNRDELNALVNVSDCYVSLHRSEGFGLTLAEAMSMGKPVIATGYSGNLDFMNLGNSFLVKHRLVEIERDHGPYKKGYVWAEPDRDHAAELMRFVFYNRETALEVGRQAQIDVKKTLSPQAVGTIVRERLLMTTSLPQANRLRSSSASSPEAEVSLANVTSMSTDGTEHILREIERGVVFSDAINQVPLRSSGLKGRVEFKVKRFLKWLVHWNTRAQADFNRSVSNSLLLTLPQLQHLQRELGALKRDESAVRERVEALQHVERLVKQIGQDVGSLKENANSFQGVARLLEQIERDVATLKRSECASQEIAGSLQSVETLLERLRQDVETLKLNQPVINEMADSLQGGNQFSERLEEIEKNSKAGADRQVAELTMLRDEMASLFKNLESSTNSNLDEMRIRIIRAERAVRQLSAIADPMTAKGRRTPFLEQTQSANQLPNNQKNRPIKRKAITGKTTESALDYFAFEHKFRGSVAEIKRRQSAYTNLFLARKNVIDLGSGRGEFLELLSEIGVPAVGVDSNEDMVEFCKDRGLHVIQADIFDYLADLPDESVDGIFIAQVVEHLPPEKISKLIVQCRKKLQSGGTFVIETVNTNCPDALANFFLDSTHVRPVPAELLRFLLEQEMFKVEFLKFSSPLPGKSASEFLDVVAALPEEIRIYRDYAAVASKP